MIILVKFFKQIYLIFISGDMLRMFYFRSKHNVVVSIIFLGFQS